MKMDHFKLEDFDCPCCGKNCMDMDHLKRIDAARDASGTPFIINSGFRCESHNADPKVGGSSNSAHLYGVASDIKALNSRVRFKIVRGLIIAGFTRIGIREDFIHADTDGHKDQKVLWLY